MSNAPTAQAERVILVQHEEELPAFAKFAYGLMYLGPIIQFVFILVVSFVGYSWIGSVIDASNYALNYVGIAHRRAPDAVQIRTAGWLIAFTCAFGVIQVVGALLMPFNVKVRHVLSVMGSALPMLSLAYIVFLYTHKDLLLDETQRLVLWFSFWSVIGGFGLGIATRMAIMSGRKTAGVIPGST